MKRGIRVFAVLTGLASGAITAHAQTELPGVTITGPANPSDGPWDTHCSVNCTPGDGTSNAPEGDGSMQVAALASLTSDIRCFSNGQGTTSRDDVDVREALAQRLYTVAHAAGNGVKRGGSFIVTWADDGQTTYEVLFPNAVGAPALNRVGVETKAGDGVAKPALICGRG